MSLGLYRCREEMHDQDYAMPLPAIGKRQTNWTKNFPENNLHPFKYS